MIRDTEIKARIIHEIEVEHRDYVKNIQVFVNGGVVVLEGKVDSYPLKNDAGWAAQRTPGVKSVANNIIVNLSVERSDKEIHRTAVKGITWNSCIDENKVEITVKDGWVTLSGTVDFEYQKLKATHIAADIIGVRGVNNFLKVIASEDRKLTA